MIKADKQLTDEKLSWLQAECKSIDGLCGMTICGAHVPTILALLDAYQHPADAALADAERQAAKLREALEVAAKTLERVHAQYGHAADAGRYPWGLGLGADNAPCDTFDGGPRGWRWLTDTIEKARAALADAGAEGGQRRR